MARRKNRLLRRPRLLPLPRCPLLLPHPHPLLTQLLPAPLVPLPALLLPPPALLPLLLVLPTLPRLPLTLLPLPPRSNPSFANEKTAFGRFFYVVSGIQPAAALTRIGDMDLSPVA